MQDDHPSIHPTASVSGMAVIGFRTRVWHGTQICDGATVGEDCIIGSGVYIDRGVVIGNRVKVQTGAQLYRGAVVEDGVFIGPLVCLANDKHPRAITSDGRLQTDVDWLQGEVHLRYGASLGAGTIVLPGVTVGRYAMTSAGSVVVQSIPDYGMVLGVPARLVGYVCVCGHRLALREGSRPSSYECPSCHAHYREVEGAGLRPE
ncbi:MAG TPA: acyltransferase [Chloroflexota bacterium]|nr:acyltransferase [Chloroflexota bacterium]